MSISDKLAEHVVGLDYESLPTDAVATTKRFILDTLGVAWAGSGAPGGEAVRALIAEEDGREESSVWAFGGRTTATSAAFLNGMSAAALDYDSVYEIGSVHPDIVALPAAWAVAERQHATGKDFLTALVVGCDLICRLGRATLRNSGWFYTSVHGVFGAAAAASKLLGLDATATRDAFGLALSQAGGTQQAILEKTLSKRMQSALAARAGVFSALLAERGVGAPEAAFEGKFGYYRMYEEGDPEHLLAGLGERFENASSTVKKYPSCTANHAAVDGAIQLAAEHDLRAEDVTGVEVVLSPASHQLVGAEFDPGGNPQVAAQFSIQYSLASALVRRRLGIAEIQNEAVLDPMIRDFARRVSVAVDETNTGKFAPAEITIATRTKGTLKRRIEQVPGTPQNPMTDAELHAKFRDCASSGAAPLTPEQMEKVIAKVAAVETVPDMARFFDGIL